MPAPPPLAVGQVGAPDDAYVPGELVLVSADMAEAQAAARAAAALGLRVKSRRRLGGLGLVSSVFRLPDGASVPEVLEALRAAQPEVWWDANHRFEPLGEAAGQPGAYGAGLMAWGPPQAECARGVRLGIVDTDVDVAHPALSGQRIVRHSLLPAGVPEAAADHGTAVAGVLLGRSDTSGLAGLVPAGELTVARVFRRGSRGAETDAELVTLGLDRLAAEGVELIGLALGGPRNRLVEAAIRRLLERNVAIVAAGGNGGEGGPPVYPAALPGVVAVAAVDARHRPYRQGTTGEYLDLAGAGVDVWVASPGGGGHYASGTSYAVPYVMAALAAVRGSTPRPWAEVFGRLVESAQDLGPAGRDRHFGWGLPRPGTCQW